MKPAILALLLLTAGAAHAADRPMTAAEFEAYTTGKTLFFGTDGYDYGIEEYFDGRRVRWSFLGDECIDGVWYPDGNNICFAYEGRDGAQCWQFFMGDSGLTARVAGDDTLSVYEIRQSREPMQCLGPRIGV